VPIMLEIPWSVGHLRAIPSTNEIVARLSRKGASVSLCPLSVLGASVDALIFQSFASDESKQVQQI